MFFFSTPYRNVSFYIYYRNENQSLLLFKKQDCQACHHLLRVQTHHIDSTTLILTPTSMNRINTKVAPLSVTRPLLSDSNFQDSWLRRSDFGDIWFIGATKKCRMKIWSRSSWQLHMDSGFVPWISFSESEVCLQLFRGSDLIANRNVGYDFFWLFHFGNLVSKWTGPERTKVLLTWVFMPKTLL
jgi:hypothetical protein